MQGQLNMAPAGKTRHDELFESYIEFREKHPEVWDLFCKFTLNRIRMGFKHYSAQAIFERIRWETDKPERIEGEWKMNNNHVAFYARDFHRLYPEFAGFFRLREQKSKEEEATGLPELKPADFPEERDPVDDLPW